jgi:hypothetical protein
MVRPVGRPLARKTVTLGELREEFPRALRGAQPQREDLRLSKRRCS